METLLRLLVLVVAIAQIGVPAFLNPFRDGGDAVRAGAPSQIEPAEYAFAIWGAIYLGALGYAIWQLLPAGRADPATLRIAPFAILLYVGSSVWLMAASQIIPLWATMPILAAMAGCAVASLAVAVRAPDPSLWRLLLMVVPFGLYAGWTVCATFVNIAEVAPQYGFDRFGLSVPIYGVASIVAATLAAALVLWLTRGELAFAATVAWALIAIIVAAQTRGYDSAIVFAAVGALSVVAVLTAALKFAPRTA